MDIPQGWGEEGGKLVKSFDFATFEDAVRFINAVAGIATRLNHHPEIWNSYNKVKITLFTHDENSISEKDYSLALEINSL